MQNGICRIILLPLQKQIFPLCWTQSLCSYDFSSNNVCKNNHILICAFLIMSPCVQCACYSLASWRSIHVSLYRPNSFCFLKPCNFYMKIKYNWCIFFCSFFSKYFSVANNSAKKSVWYLLNMTTRTVIVQSIDIWIYFFIY